MHLRHAVFLALAPIALLACGTTIQDACRDDAAVSCEKMWTCDAPVKFGNNQDSCVETVQGLCALAECDEGKTFNSAKADECAEARKAQTCAEYNSEGDPAVCNQFCE